MAVSKWRVVHFVKLAALLRQDRAPLDRIRVPDAATFRATPRGCFCFWLQSHRMVNDCSVGLKPKRNFGSPSINASSLKALEPSNHGLRSNFSVTQTICTLTCLKWCPEEDSNLHASRRCYLKAVRLPIPPSGQRKRGFRGHGRRRQLTYHCVRFDFALRG